MSPDNEYIASVTVNRSGRILSADMKFCTLFGLRPDECEWHYISDYIGGPSSWERIRESLKTSEVQVRNRTGRSFLGSITPCPVRSEGNTVYSCMIIRK